MNKVETLDLQKMNKVKCNYFFCYHEMMKIDKMTMNPQPLPPQAPAVYPFFGGASQYIRS